MASHFHAGDSVKDYFTEQLLTILVCGLVGFAAVDMYRSGMLGFLTEPFQRPVLYGGIALLVIVVLRAIAVWREAGRLQGAHIHGPDCNTDCAHGPLDDEDDHAHAHNTDLSWVVARMLVLAFPVCLFFLGLPSATLSQDFQNRLLGKNESISAAELQELAKGAAQIEEKKSDDGSIVRILKTKNQLKIRESIPKDGGAPRYELLSDAGTAMKFNDLNDAAYDQAKRESLEGQTVILEGKFNRIADKEFMLYRIKMTCCAADAVPLKVRIQVPQALGAYAQGEWVQVKGVVQFVQLPGQSQYIPLLIVADTYRDVKRVPGKNEYE